MELSLYDFYCRYGNHWKNKSEKIPTARQGNFICAECEEKRSKHQVKSHERNRRRDDLRHEKQDT